jgi:hypothetical protein
MTDNTNEEFQHYEHDGYCVSIPCQNRYLGEPGAATHMLTTRETPDEWFPDGLLVKAEYCYHDGVYFAGKAALAGREVISLEPIKPE